MNIQLIHEEGGGLQLKDELRNLLLYIILQFPLSSIVKVYIGSLNLILTGTVFLLFFYCFFRYRIKVRELYLVVYIILTLIQNVFLWGFNYYEDNMLFYFPFLILYFCFFVRNASYIYEFMKKNKIYIDIILIVWCIIVVISMFIPKCYIFEGETLSFVSFAGTTFLLCPIAIYIFVLLVFQYCVHKNIIYIIGLFVPSLCVFMGTTRTYLIVLFCAWLVFLYVLLRNKKIFIPVLIVGGAVFITIALASPVKEKFIDTLGRVQDLGLDTITAFSSSRNLFWEYDIKTIFSNKPIKILFGNGVEYLFNINRAKFDVPLWAHNDFIQILSDYGLFGIFVYLYMIKFMIANFFKGEKISKILICIIIVMWFFNAFFNMFYTYFCAVLSFPFFLLVVKYDAERERILRSNSGEK